MQIKWIGMNEFHTPCSHTTLFHTATGYTPFELVFGYKATSALTKSPYCYDYAKELKEQLRTNRIAREYIIKAKLTAK